MGGDGTAPNVTVLPLQVSTPEYGPVQLPLFRVDKVNDNDEVVDSRFVTNNGQLFGSKPEEGLSSFENWRKNNTLPDGVVTYPPGGHMTADANGKVQLKSEGTPETHNTWHHVEKFLDKAVLVGGVIAGTCLTFGVGGVIAAGVMVGAGIYSAARQGEELYGIGSRGQTLDPTRSSEARAHWLNGAAALFGSAGVGANALRLGNTIRISTAAVGITADALAMGNQGRDVVLNWDKMAPDQKVMAGLQFAFWGGTTGVQLRGGLRGMFDFQALRQTTDHAVRKAAGRVLTLRFGSPKPSASASRMPAAEFKQSDLRYLGSGEKKNGYALGENQVVTMVKPGGNSQEIYQELDLLAQIRNQGYPTVGAKLATVDGQPAILMDRYALDSKKIVDRDGRRPKIKGESPYLNEQSIADLQRIRELNAKGPVILDLQFLIGKDGHVVVADPKAIMSEANPFWAKIKKYNDDLLKLLIQQAQKHR